MNLSFTKDFKNILLVQIAKIKAIYHNDLYKNHSQPSSFGLVSYTESFTAPDNESVQSAS